jgi:hypothetical protein
VVNCKVVEHKGFLLALYLSTFTVKVHGCEVMYFAVDLHLKQFVAVFFLSYNISEKNVENLNLRIEKNTNDYILYVGFSTIYEELYSMHCAPFIIYMSVDSPYIPFRNVELYHLHDYTMLI